MVPCIAKGWTVPRRSLCDFRGIGIGIYLRPASSVRDSFVGVASSDFKGPQVADESDAPPPGNPHTAEQCGLKGPLKKESPASGVSSTMPGGSSEMFGNRVRFRLAPSTRVEQRTGVQTTGKRRMYHFFSSPKLHIPAHPCTPCGSPCFD